MAYRHSEEVKARLREIMKDKGRGVPKSDETKAKMSAAKKAMWAEFKALKEAAKKEAN